MPKACQQLLEEFVACLSRSDCVQRDKKDIKVCAQQVEACAGLRYTYYQCKRGQLDARSRIGGVKGTT